MFVQHVSNTKDTHLDATLAKLKTAFCDHQVDMFKRTETTVRFSAVWLIPFTLL